MIYTSCFRNWKKVPHPIAISRGVPAWYEGEKYEILAPSWELLDDFKNGIVTQRQYCQRYIDELVAKKVTAEMLKNELPDGCTLLCWEGAGKFCHRLIIAGILRRVGVQIEEWYEKRE